MVKDKEVVIPPFRELFAEEIAQSEQTTQEIDEIFRKTGKVPNSGKIMSNGWCMIDCGTFDEFSECSVSTYYAMAKECVKRGITHVYDVGCCTAWQARIFNSVGISYTGIEVSSHDLSLSPFKTSAKEKNVEYINKAYPFPISVKDKEHTAVISNLCVGYGLLEGNPERKEDFTHKMYEQIAKDFDYFIGSVGPDDFKYFNSRFGVLSHDTKGHCSCWGNRERFHEFNEEAKKEIFRDMLIFPEFGKDFMLNMVKEDKPKSTKISLIPKIVKIDREMDSR